MRRNYLFEGSFAEGERLDLFVRNKLNFLSRSFIQTLVQQGDITVSEEKVRPSHRLKRTDLIRVEIPPASPEILEAEPIPLQIIWEDDSLLVLNKPAGMIVHPTRLGQKGTLVNALIYYSPHLSQVSGSLRQGIVHRLDRGTSGIMVVAKNDLIHLALSAQFRKREVRKIYLALVRGVPRRNEGVIEARIARSPRAGNKMILTQTGRESITHFKVVNTWAEKWSLLELHPLTGRTHQIRIHLRFVGCPVLGDQVYGGKKEKFPGKTKRVYLHAKTLGFYHPLRKEWMQFETPLPEDMQEAIKFLGEGE